MPRLINKLLTLSLAIACGALLFADRTVASESENRRIEISLNIFPKIVGVDIGLRQKLSTDGRVVLLLAYEFNEPAARKWAYFLRPKVDKIGQYQVEVKVKSVASLAAGTGEAPTAIFITEQMSDDAFHRLITYAKANHILVFSPLSGDVERGATAGIFISSRIKPFFNVDTLQASNVEINPMIMKMSKQHHE